jgi:nucleoside-diphosphate-sugar epimerase
MNGKKIFITGGFGFIGSKLAVEATKRGYSVFLYDSLIYKQNYRKILKEIESVKAKNASLEWTIGDTRNTDLLRESLKKFKPDFLFHFAELVGIYVCDSNSKHTEEINYTASKKVIDIAEELNIPIVYNSTSSLYGNQKTSKLLKENSPLPHFTDNYCKNKLKMEEYINKKIKSNPKFKILVLRPATIWGVAPRMRIELLPNHFAYCAISKGKIKVAQPNSYRAEMDIDDIVNSYFAIIKKNEWKKHFYNLGNHNLSKIEVAEIVKSVIPCNIEIVGDMGDVRNLRIDSTSFYEDFDWKPKYSFENTTKKVKTWLTKNLKEVEKTNFDGIINSPLDQWLKII